MVVRRTICITFYLAYHYAFSLGSANLVEVILSHYPIQMIISHSVQICIFLPISHIIAAFVIHAAAIHYDISAVHHEISGICVSYGILIDSDQFADISIHNHRDRPLRQSSAVQRLPIWDSPFFKASMFNRFNVFIGVIF